MTEKITHEQNKQICNRRYPLILSIRGTAKLGILSETALRRMHKEGKLPGFNTCVKFNVDVDKLCAMLENGEYEDLTVCQTTRPKNY